MIFPVLVVFHPPIFRAKNNPAGASVFAETDIGGPGPREGPGGFWYVFHLGYLGDGSSYL
jgi:hypothetical protein